MPDVWNDMPASAREAWEEADEEFWAVINSDPLSAYWVANALQRYEREESYRAALARGVWWG